MFWGGDAMVSALFLACVVEMRVPTNDKITFMKIQIMMKVKVIQIIIKILKMKYMEIIFFMIFFLNPDISIKVRIISPRQLSFRLHTRRILLPGIPFLEEC